LNALAVCVITIVQGGDHFAGWRPFQAIWPLLFAPTLLVCSYALQLVTRFDVERAIPPVAIALSLTAVFTPSRAWWSLNAAVADMSIEFELARRGRTAGTHLNHMFTSPEKPRLGVIAAGGIGYAYDGPVIDLLGLNDISMAHASRKRYGLHGHSAFDIATFYNESPDIVVTSASECALQRPQLRMVHDWSGGILLGIARQGRFQETYAPAVLTYAKLAERQLGLCEWAKRSLIENHPATVELREVFVERLLRE
jgi:hypothetical protein